MSKNLFYSINKINQSLRVKKSTVVLPYSKQTLSFISLLYNQNYVDNFQCINNNILCTFKKNQGKSVFTKIQTVSKKGQSKVSKVSSLFIGSSVNFGSFVISTPFGLLLDKTAIKINTSGVIFCSIV